MPPSHFSTKERILDAAEELFARRGFDGASLRQLTSDAGVNLASVNYHFGSKDKLIEEVFRRRLDILNGQRLDALDRLTRQATLEDVLMAFIQPALELSREGRGGGAFVRILARAYVEHDEQLRSFLSDNYGDVLKRFAAALAERLPTLDKQELYWRLDIVTGALTYAMANFGIIRRQAGISEEQHMQQVMQHLVHFAAAGLRTA
ncbi:MAG TPA: TetR/AcrR family transcriptional regulator [Rhodanobacteraceae bacterium]|nr:TetR/AcrR family transcriptional regulator [Rhodanobacteraceae bacterium]